MSSEVKADRCDAIICQFTCKSGYRDYVPAGEYAVHQDHHRAFLGFGVEVFRKCYVHSDAALWTVDLEVAGSCGRGDQDEEDGEEVFHNYRPAGP